MHYTHTHTHTHTQIHTDTNTHTHTRTHTPSQHYNEMYAGKSGYFALMQISLKDNGSYTYHMIQ